MKSIYTYYCAYHNIGQKLTNQITQYMIENWRGFHMLVTDGYRWSQMVSMAFGSLQKELLSALPAGF